MKHIAIIGYGVVGGGITSVIEENKAFIERMVGDSVNVKYILDLREFPDSPYGDRVVHDIKYLIEDSEISVVCETMGGSHPAYEYSIALLRSGKSVVTSNKEVVASFGDDLLRCAKENGVSYLFEASVGGGIPIIRPMHQCLAANQISEVAGILNGTTNFILTKMIEEQMPFDTALKLAQELGYAERDPSADVEGHDACRKICILASLAFGEHVYPQTVYTEGITKLSLDDVAYADSFDGVIKLIGRAKRLSEGKMVATVFPAILDKHSQLANINDVFNGILIRGDATGDVVFYGRGAGKLPTASAVVADIIDITKANCTSKSLSWKDSSGCNVADYKISPLRFYIKLHDSDIDSVREKIAQHFGQVDYLARPGQPVGEVAFVTAEMTETELEQKMDAIGVSADALIRVLDY